MITRIEDFLETRWEGLFKRAFPRSLEPSDLARALYKQMLQQRLKSIKYIYVPNYYLIRLHPRDYQGFASYQQSLVEELVEYLEKKARHRQFHLLQPLEIHLDFDGEIPLGRIKVFGRLQEAPKPPNLGEDLLLQSGPSSGEGDTLIYRQEPLKEVQSTYQWVVEVVKGIDKGNVYPLIKFRNLIGRQINAEINLVDPGVSRHHAQLEVFAQHVLLTDLGSTNGTLHQGELVDTVLLHPGEQFQVGHTNLLLREKIHD